MQNPSLDFFSYPVYPIANHQTIIPTQGANERKIVLIGKGIATLEQTAFLDKILAAILIDRQRDTACIDTAQTQICFEKVLHQLQPKWGILFGVQPNDLSWRVQLPAYQWVEWQGCKWLLAHSLVDLQGALQAYKKNLWNCLQQAFK